jgi:hypothetical protein
VAPNAVTHPEAEVEDACLAEAGVEGALDADELSDRIGGRQRQDRGRQDGGADQPDGEQAGGQVPGQRLERRGRLGRVGDGDASLVQGGRAGHDHEHADEAGEDRSRHHIDPLVAEVARGEPLVDGVGLQEAQAPRSQGRADRRGDDEHGAAIERHGRFHHALRRCGPVWVGQHTGRDVGGEH